MNLSPRKLAAALTMVVLAVVAVTVTATTADAQHQKGCGEQCCVLECYEKEVEVVCWKCECEEFCLPGPCCIGCKNFCDPCGGKCGKGGTCGKKSACQSGAVQKGCGLFGKCGKLFCWRDECPGDCPTHHHKKVLYRKIEVVKVPAYRWVIRGCKCGDKHPEGAVLPDAGDVPAPPPVDAAQLRYRIQQDGVIMQAQGITAQLTDVMAR